MATQEKSKKTKRPTALKRDIRNAKRQEINKAFKSKIRTTVRSLEEGNKDALPAVYSVLDRAVKRGIYKQNKANRLKARATTLAGA